jgi:hypothetical protein
MSVAGCEEMKSYHYHCQLWRPMVYATTPPHRTEKNLYLQRHLHTLEVTVSDAEKESWVEKSFQLDIAKECRRILPGQDDIE